MSLRATWSSGNLRATVSAYVMIRRAAVVHSLSSICIFAYMMTYRPIYDPHLWRRRAQATRIKADSLEPGKARDRLLKVAEEYEKLAKHAEECGPPNSEDLNSRLDF